jgi:hypothetical protein
MATSYKYTMPYTLKNNDQRPQFGFGPSRGTVDRRAAIGVTIALLIVVGLELLTACCGPIDP